MPSAAKPSNGSHFKTLQDFTADYCPTRFVLYESERTGMRVVVVDQKGPKVNGYFTLATEIHDDSGAPHTLEHLVFMGSKSYRYKGILDKLAARAYSNTNAWTAVDHTAYTLDTAGWHGFAQILPVYLEHVLLPTLTDAACYTEVHHVDGDGHDAGVVYSEMQGTQNTQGELMELAARRKIYPESVGFRYETGGLMEKLRVLTAERIRSFHREMYQPKNLCLVLIGEVDHSDLLSILDKFEDGIQGEVPRLDEPFTRPWTQHGHTPSLKESTTQVVEFPEADESMGEILIGYLGPPYDDDILGLALDVWLNYVCGSSIALLDNIIVEKEQLASGIYYTTEIRPDVAVWFTLSGVATEKLDEVKQRFFDVLSEAVEKPLDMAYMKDCIRRFRRQVVFAAENSARTFADSVIYDHLFGKRDGTDLRKLGTLQDLDSLHDWTEEDWKKFWKTWFADAHSVTVLGKPSKRLADSVEENEKKRVEDQQSRLGEEGLKKLKEKLDAARAENEVEIPKKILEDFEVPGTDSIHFIPTVTARSGFAKKLGREDNNIQKGIDKDAGDLETFIHFEHIPTNFVHVQLILCTHTIPVELRPLISIYLANFFETPVRRNGEVLQYEDVVNKLEQDTVGYSINLGGITRNSELIVIKLQVEQPKYQTAISWIRDLLYNSIFDPERLASSFAKILADLPESKRSGSRMLSAVDQMIHISKESTNRAQSSLVKALYIPRTFRELQSNPEAIIEKLEKIRKILTQPENFRAIVFANLDPSDPKSLQDPVSSWNLLTKDVTDISLPVKQLNPIDSRRAVRSAATKNPGSIAYLVPMQTSDSSFATLTGRGLDQIQHPQRPALVVALAYLEAVEGPLWTSVRGAGLAYGVNFARDTELATLQFDIYRSPDAHRAYAAARDVVAGYASGRTPLEPLELEGAVSSIVVSFANEQPSMAAAAAVGFTNTVIHGIPKDWGTSFLAAVRNVTADDVREALQQWVAPVFDPKTSNLVCTCAKIMVEKLQKGFEEEGFKVEVKELKEFQEGYGTLGEEGEEELDYGDDDEGEDDDDEEDDEDEDDD